MAVIHPSQVAGNDTEAQLAKALDELEKARMQRGKMKTTLNEVYGKFGSDEKLVYADTDRISTREDAERQIAELQKSYKGSLDELNRLKQDNEHLRDLLEKLDVTGKKVTEGLLPWTSNLVDVVAGATHQ